jgi:hypothetical protein
MKHTMNNHFKAHYAQNSTSFLKNGVYFSSKKWKWEACMPVFVCLAFFLFFIITPTIATNTFIDFNKGDMLLVDQSKAGFSILVDQGDYKGVLRALTNLKADFEAVSGVTPVISYSTEPSVRIVAGSLENSVFIQQLVKDGLIDSKELINKREKYIIKLVKDPLKLDKPVLVIAGSDKRGTIYGIYELSRQIGVSPWYYWADVPIKKQAAIYIKKGVFTDGEPAVRYRGIFINDEAPSLSGWVHEKFGDYNHQFYEKVFELILRLKGNFLWPAMWGNAFYDDDPLNGPLADEMGIVMGTSHHEPMARAQKEWHKYGTGVWNFATNADKLKDFWVDGIKRAKTTEDLITVGMRGDGDLPMTAGTNIALLENIVAEQRKIIASETGRGEAALPQVWALYKEVQDYYDQGMTVPDDVTLLYADDNWGNLRRLPALNAKPRSGGYGIYYHFDFVGGPRNSKWLNVTQIQRVWEQMNLAYERGVDRIWIVNVGDIKPMEYPINFWMDMAWNPKQFKPENLYEHTVDFCAEQFGIEQAKEAARILNLYSKFNARVTPEQLDDKTYSLANYNEFKTVVDEYVALEQAAQKQFDQLSPSYRDAYDQLIRFPVMASSNLYEMYYAVAMNKKLAAKKDITANQWADKVKTCFQRDTELTRYYNLTIANGKWNHMMDQTHIGYRSWQEPRSNVMPRVTYVQ